MTSYILLEGGADKLLEEDGTSVLVLEDHVAAGGGTQALAGTIAATSAVSGTTLSMTYALAGSLAATSSVSGTTPAMTYGLAGSTTGAASVTGTTLRMTYALVGSLAGALSTTGTLSLNGAVTTDPNALKFTYRETGHTMTLRERGHTMTFRERA